MIEVRVGRDLFYYHEVCPTHSARSSPQAEDSLITANKYFTDTKNKHISKYGNDTISKAESSSSKQAVRIYFSIVETLTLPVMGSYY